MLNTVFFKKKEKIGELLIRKGKITKGEMERAMAHMETADQGLGEILISLGFISELDLVETLAEQVEEGFGGLEAHLGEFTGLLVAFAGLKHEHGQIGRAHV